MKASKLALLLIALLFATNGRAQESAYTPDAEYPFIIISKDTVTAPPSFTDREFKDAATAVYFKVNKSVIQDGDAFFRLYNDVILPRINGQHLQLRKVFVRGAASPEGPYANNVRLGNERSRNLLNTLQRELSHQYEAIDQEVSSVTEDYGYLCLLMEEKADPDYQTVKGIYDECGGDELCCKQRLQAAQGGRLWKRLLKEYFPELRAARLILWFTEPDEQHAPPSRINTLDDLPPMTTEGTIAPVDVTYTPLQTAPPEPATYTRRHVVALRTNLVHDLFVMPRFGFAPSPNLQFEVYPLRGHYTYNAAITWGTRRLWDTHEFWQVRDIQAEVRRYFKGHGKFLGFYAGAYAHGGKYGIGLDEKHGWQGEYGGVGLTGGYTMPLTKRGDLRLEFMVAAGAIGSRFDPYVYGNPVTGTIDGDYYYLYYGSASKFKERNHQAFYAGPTNIGIQLTYDIIYRKKTRSLPKRAGRGY